MTFPGMYYGRVEVIRVKAEITVKLLQTSLRASYLLLDSVFTCFLPATSQSRHLLYVKEFQSNYVRPLNSRRESFVVKLFYYSRSYFWYLLQRNFTVPLYLCKSFAYIGIWTPNYIHSHTHTHTRSFIHTLTHSLTH